MLQNWSYPEEQSCFVWSLMAATQPMSHTSGGLAENGRHRLGAVQVIRPAADRRWIGQAIRVLKLGQCLFPRAVLHKASQ